MTTTCLSDMDCHEVTLIRSGDEANIRLGLTLLLGRLGGRIELRPKDGRYWMRQGDAEDMAMHVLELSRVIELSRQFIRSGWVTPFDQMLYKHLLGYTELEWRAQDDPIDFLYHSPEPPLEKREPLAIEEYITQNFIQHHAKSKTQISAAPPVRVGRDLHRLQPHPRNLPASRHRGGRRVRAFGRGR